MWNKKLKQSFLSVSFFLGIALSGAACGKDSNSVSSDQSTQIGRTAPSGGSPVNISGTDGANSNATDEARKILGTYSATLTKTDINGNWIGSQPISFVLTAGTHSAQVGNFTVTSNGLLGNLSTSGNFMIYKFGNWNYLALTSAVPASIISKLNVAFNLNLIFSGSSVSTLQFNPSQSGITIQDCAVSDACSAQLSGFSITGVNH